MGLCVEILAIGPFNPDIVGLLEYPREFYAATRPGAPVLVSLFGIVEGTTTGAEFAAAVGITDPWDFNQHCIDPARIDFQRVRHVLSQVAEREDYLRDTDRMEALARHGFSFYFRPNG